MVKFFLKRVIGCSMDWCVDKLKKIRRICRKSWQCVRSQFGGKPIATKFTNYRDHIASKFKTRNNYQAKQKKFKKYVEQNQLAKRDQQFICSICIEPLIFPCSTPCGHHFCLKCLEQALLFNPLCPCCRSMTRGIDIEPCQLLQNYITKYVKLNFSDPDFKLYKQRLTECTKWKQGRRVDAKNLSVDDVIDVRDTEYIWCRAHILKIIHQNDQIHSILVHYQGWNKIYDEIIEVKSQRLAPLNFFSGLKSIPRYNLQEEDQNMRGAVIHGQPQEQRIEPPRLRIFPPPMRLGFQNDAWNGGGNEQVLIQLRPRRNRLPQLSLLQIFQRNNRQQPNFIQVDSDQNDQNAIQIVDNREQLRGARVIDNNLRNDQVIQIASQNSQENVRQERDHEQENQEENIQNDVQLLQYSDSAPMQFSQVLEMNIEDSQSSPIISLRNRPRPQNLQPMSIFDPLPNMLDQQNPQQNELNGVRFQLEIQQQEEQQQEG